MTRLGGSSDRKGAGDGSEVIHSVSLWFYVRMRLLLALIFSSPPGMSTATLLKKGCCLILRAIKMVSYSWSETRRIW